MRTATILTILLVTLLAGGAGCSSGSGGGGDNAAQLVRDGWTAYLSADYRTAASKFDQAIALDGSLVDAYNGAGWANAKLDSLATAVVRYNDGLARDTANNEIRAGLAFVGNALKQYASSIGYASAVLQSNPSWVFSRDNAVNQLDLHLLLAEDYFAIPDYPQSLAQVRILNPSFTADVSTTAGRTQLAKEIERLRTLL